jgi:hypothetical protein
MNSDGNMSIIHYLLVLFLACVSCVDVVPQYGSPLNVFYFLCFMLV